MRLHDDVNANQSAGKSDPLQKMMPQRNQNVPINERRMKLRSRKRRQKQRERKRKKKQGQSNDASASNIHGKKVKCASSPRSVKDLSHSHEVRSNTESVNNLDAVGLHY